MMVDMDGLAKAEKELQELQSKLQQRDSELELLPKGKRTLFTTRAAAWSSGTKVNGGGGVK